MNRRTSHNRQNVILASFYGRGGALRATNECETVLEHAADANSETFDISSIRKTEAYSLKDAGSEFDFSLRQSERTPDTASTKLPLSSDETRRPSKLTLYAMYAVCALVWGTGWYAIRLSVSEGGYPIFGGAALRYTLAALILGAMIPIFPKAFGRVNRRETVWLLLAGVFNAAAIALLYWGEKSISGGLASVLSATSPIMMAMIAFFTRTEKISAGTIIGFCLSLAGIGIIFGERLTVTPEHVIAMGAILGAALFFALTNFVMKVKATTVKPLQSSVMFFASMSIIFWIAAPCEAPAMPWPPPAAAPTYALVYLSVACSALAFPAFFFVLRHSSLMFASTLAFVHPVIALLTDCALEHEFMLTMSGYSGMSVVLVGVILSMVSNGRAVKTEPERVRV